MTSMTKPRRTFSGTFAGAVAFARSEAVLLVALSIVAGAILAFIGIADEMAEGDAHAFDLAVLNAIQPEPGNPIGPKWLSHAAEDFTALGSVSILLTITLATAGFLALRRKFVEAGMLALAFTGALAISEALKGVFGRERPPEIYRAVEALNPSFPSGHALLSAVVYLTLGAMLARASDNHRLRAYFLGVAMLVAVLVGFTRIYLGVHWTSDVLAGWSLGAAWATACWLLDRWLRTRGRSREASS
jgi:undecaprenyl-diphosphatase